MNIGLLELLKKEEKLLSSIENEKGIVSDLQISEGCRQRHLTTLSENETELTEVRKQIKTYISFIKNCY